VKKRDRSVRNRKVRRESVRSRWLWCSYAAGDFRKEEASEGGWSRPKAVPKRLGALANTAGRGKEEEGEEQPDHEVHMVDDESGGDMEDNGFDDGQGKERGRAGKKRPKTESGRSGERPMSYMA
jgi:hypothetical protein